MHEEGVGSQLLANRVTVKQMNRFDETREARFRFLLLFQALQRFEMLDCPK